MSKNNILTVKERKSKIAKDSAPYLWSQYLEGWGRRRTTSASRLHYIVRPVLKPTTTSPQACNSTEAGICLLGHLRGLLSSLTSLQALIVYCPNASSLILKAYISLEVFCRFVNESPMLIILSMNFLGCRSWFYMSDECIWSILRATLSGRRVWAEQAASSRIEGTCSRLSMVLFLPFRDACYGKHCPTLLTSSPWSLLSSFRNSEKHGVLSLCSRVAPPSPFRVLRQLATLTHCHNFTDVCCQDDSPGSIRTSRGDFFSSSFPSVTEKNEISVGYFPVLWHSPSELGTN